VLPAVELNDQPSVVTAKINNVTPNWRLPPKTQTIQTMGTKCKPQARLSIRHLVT